MKTQKNIWKTFSRKFNFKRFSIFLLAAFLFLILTKFSETYTQAIEFQLELVGLEDEVIVKKDTLQILKTVVRAKGFNLLPYMVKSNNTIAIDSKMYTTKANNLLLFNTKENRHIVANKLGNAIKILSIKPDTVYFNYDVMSSKWVKIKLNKEIEYVSGFDVVDGFKLSQDSVKIIGSSSQLDTINVINTKVLKLKDVKDNINQRIELESLGDAIDILPNSVFINGKVSRFTEGKIALNVELINAPLDKTINYFPKTVDLFYYVDLERFKEVDGNDFSVIADFNNLQGQDQNFLELKVNKASSLVKTTRLSQNRIEFIILEK